MLTLYTHFVNSINLPNTSPSNAEGEHLADLITKYETKMLKDIFGKTFYDLLQANINQGSGIYHDIVAGKNFTDSNGFDNSWVGFVTIGQNPIANFIYCMYQESNFTNTMGIGERKGKAENMATDSPARKIRDAWNEMVDWLWILHDFMYINHDSYPSYIGLTFPPYQAGGSYPFMYSTGLQGITGYNRIPNQRYFRYKNLMGI